MRTLTGTKISSPLIQLTAILFFVEFVRSAFLISFLPVYAVDELGISVAFVGLAVSLHYAADTGIKSVAGYLLDRFSSRLMLHLSLACGLTGLFVAFVAAKPWLLIAGTALLGIGVSPIWLICLSKVREENRGSQMGTIYTVWLSSLGLGPVVMNFALDRGYMLSFGIMAAMFVLGWVFTSSGNFEIHSAIRTVPLKKQIVQLKKRLVMMKPLVPGMILQTAAAGLLVPILPGFARKYLNLSYSDYSLVLIVGGIFTVLFLIPMGRLSDKWGHKWFLVVGFACLATCLYLLLFSGHLYATLLLAGALGLSYSAVLPAWNALMAGFVPPDQKGMGWGILSSVEGIGIMVGPVAGGWLADLFSEGVTVTVSATLLAGIAVVYLLIPRKKLLDE